MRRFKYVSVTILMMLVVSRFVIRILDATLQVENIGLVFLGCLLVVNVLIVYGSYKVYHREL